MDVHEYDRYFIGIAPSFEIGKEIIQFKDFVATEFQSVAALRSPPHITLHMPFLWKRKKEAKLISALDEFSRNEPQFRIDLNGFDCFPPRVIFVRVTPSEPLTNLEIKLGRMCREKLNLANARYKEFPFHPHLTIAFRDLRKNVFNKAWQHFYSKPYSACFNADVLTLFKQDDNRWTEHNTFLLH